MRAVIVAAVAFALWASSMAEVSAKRTPFNDAKDFSERIVKALAEAGFTGASGLLLAAQISVECGPNGYGCIRHNVGNLTASRGWRLRHPLHQWHKIGTWECEKKAGASHPHCEAGYTRVDRRRAFRSYPTLTAGIKAMVRVLKARRYRRAWTLLHQGSPEYWRVLGSCGYYTASRHLYYHLAAKRARQIAKHVGAEAVLKSMKTLATWKQRQQGLKDINAQLTTEERASLAAGTVPMHPYRNVVSILGPWPNGTDPGVVDGQRGPRTETAIAAFQCHAGIKVDGYWGPQTRRTLRASLLPEVVASVSLG